jgi:predicted aspartyl protease
LAGKTWITGPNVEVTLHSDDLGSPPAELHGIIDTGASVICLDSRIAKRLGLVASDKRWVEMADGRVLASPVYSARMTIPALGFDSFVQVCAVDMEYPSNRILLGRSFLRDYIVNYGGPKEQFQFHETSRDQQYYFDHDE